MKADKLASDRYLLEVSADEFRLIVGALGEICFAIDDFELYARLGVKPERAKEVAKGLRQQADQSGLEL